jgi:hypothetical protein
MPDKDGTGPRRGSYMRDELGRKGPRSGHEQGNCRPEYKRR